MKWILSAAMAACLSLMPHAFAQAASVQPTPTEVQDANMHAYVELLHADIRSDKTAIMGEVSGLSEDQGAKFWLIYHEYDLELQKLNDKKLAGIEKYAKNHDSMTNENAHSLAEFSLELGNQRNDLKKVKEPTLKIYGTAVLRYCIVA